MDGATMLGEIKKRDPEVVTVLLTGQTDFESAMSAVKSPKQHKYVFVLLIIPLWVSHSGILFAVRVSTKAISLKSLF